MLAAVGLLLVNLGNLSPVNAEIVATFLFAVGFYSTLPILFLQKVRDLMSNDDGASLKLKMRDVKKRILGTMTGGSGSDNGGQSSAFAQAERKLGSANTTALHGLSLDERFAMCQQQLEFWRTMLVAVEEKRSSDTNSGSGSATGLESTQSGWAQRKPGASSVGGASSAVYVAEERSSIEEEERGSGGDGEGATQTDTASSLEKVPEEV